MITPDSIDPIPFLIIMAVLVTIWLWIGCRDRRRYRREAADLRIRVATWEREQVLGRCAHVWKNIDDRYLVCGRPFEHTGPHLHSPTGELLR